MTVIAQMSIILCVNTNMVFMIVLFNLSVLPAAKTG
jgi:hypothetical protein